MWVVAEEDFDRTICEYALLAEAERFEASRTTDARYHAAKLMAAAFHEPSQIWSEHEEYRADVFAPRMPHDPMTPSHWQSVGMIYRQLERAGILPAHGAN